MNIQLTQDRSAAVNHGLYWISVDGQPPPRGAKVLLINEKFGVAVLGPYTPGQGWT